MHAYMRARGCRAMECLGPRTIRAGEARAGARALSLEPRFPEQPSGTAPPSTSVRTANSTHAKQVGNRLAAANLDNNKSVSTIKNRL